MWTSERQKSTLSTDVLAHFANFKLAGDRAIRDVTDTITSVSAPSTTASASTSRGGSLQPRGGVGRRGRKRRGRYTQRRQSSRRIGAMSDADLEAELAARRAQRARERERYARSMRSDKLQVLEMELNRLRSKIGGGTPANPRWESLGPDGRGRAPSLNSSVRREPPGTPMPGRGGPSAAPGPPPPPPMGGLRDPNEEEEIDPEQQKREKAERQRRREAKRKEREANKKPMTLADIIRSAGRNPIARLKPKGSTATEDVNDPQPEVQNEIAAVTLKKAEKKEGEEEEKEEESELSKALKKAAEGAEGKSENVVDEGKEEPNSENEPSNDEGKDEDESKKVEGSKDEIEKEKSSETAEVKSTETSGEVTPVAVVDSEAANPSSEADTSIASDSAKDVAKDEVLSKTDATRNAGPKIPTAPAMKAMPTSVAETEIEPVVVEKEKTTANGTKSQDTLGKKAVKAQLSDVLGKLAVKKVLKDTKPSSKNMDSNSPDKGNKAVPLVDVENKEAEKPNLDTFLKTLAEKRKKSV